VSRVVGRLPTGGVPLAGRRAGRLGPGKKVRAQRGRGSAPVAAGRFARLGGSAARPGGGFNAFDLWLVVRTRLAQAFGPDPRG
jgi:hypothetical protein